MPISPIHHTFAPHVDATYVWNTLKLLAKPWKWQKGKEAQELRTTLAQHFHAEVTLFASGREALLALFQSLNIGKGDEVIIQSYTCIVVPNAITASGATPIYADIDPDTLNLTPETVERVISNRTKAVICQHTFGIPADTERLRELCDQYELPLIEDCAHIIPDTKGPKDIGRYGDYLILSFGRDKAISGIAGGALITKIKNARLPDGQAKLTMQNDGTSNSQPSISAESGSPNRRPTSSDCRASEGYLALQSKRHIFCLLLYPILYFIARPLYRLGIGKLLLWLAAKLGLLVPIVTRKEKEGHMPVTLHTIPNACAALALSQFQKLQEINDHRRMLTKFYLQACKDRGWPVLEGITEDLPLQKFSMFLPSPDHLRSILKHKNIHLDDGWIGCTTYSSSKSIL